MDFSQIQELIRMVSKHKLSEFSLKEGDFKLIIRNQSGQEGAAPTVVHTVAAAPAAPSSAPTPPPALAPKADTPATAAPASDENARYVSIKSPMVGTFYRSGGPDKPPFLKVGDEVQKGQTVCIIEAMKLFNEIESDLTGKVVKILVEDSTPVEYDQPLFLLDPS
ncbi:MAG: acetyl-CoA carboxylase biotin carboxyl carrier protein [Saprospiraceae bacterium]